MDKINDTSKTSRQIVDTGKAAEKISPEEFARGIGTEPRPMNSRLDTLLAKMQEALNIPFDAGHLPKVEARAVLRLALAELPLIRDQYEREIAKLREELNAYREHINMHIELDPSKKKGE